MKRRPCQRPCGRTPSGLPAEGAHLRCELGCDTLHERALEILRRVDDVLRLRTRAKGISALADNPELGVSRDAVRAGYRAHFINSDAVYYTITPGAIFIVRVLHEGMDPGRHL